MEKWNFFDKINYYMELLEVKNLTKKFKGKKGDVLAVDNISFSASKGEIFGLLGPNGAGKTTTIRLIATTLAPTGGTAVVGGFDIHKHPAEVRRQIGVLTTDIGVYDRFSGRENLRYYGHLYGLEGQDLENRIDELIKLLDMSDFTAKRAGKYSTGMKQKLAIARSVIHDPKVIIFDEPTSGLDVIASQTVIAFMHRMKELGKLVVLSTHQMPDAERLCDRIAIIHQGKLIALDKISVLKEQTNTQNLEDTFLKLIKQKHLRSEPQEEQEQKKGMTGDSKIKLIRQIRIASLIVLLIGIAAFFIPSLQQYSIVTNALILVGALGAVVTKTYFKKYK